MRRGWSCWALSSPLSPNGVTWAQKNVHVLGPVQCLSLLSIHGVSVSRSPRSLPGFKFKLCVLCVSPDGKISLYPGSEGPALAVSGSVPCPVLLDSLQDAASVPGFADPPAKSIS